MRESDVDCVQSHEDFTFADPGIKPDTPLPDASGDATAGHEVKKPKDGGLESLGGGRLD
ncbi:MULTISPECIES: hypothetical protein [unclassified Pseudomonas]|uniref:hypothetical protein n=1 Tax=unclassified Pseudomonas TaxID=196821 RepID=UPI0030DBDC68